MARVPVGYTPTLRLHRQSGKAIVTLSGKDHLLGAFGSIDASVKYHELVSRWIAGGRKPLDLLPVATAHTTPTCASVRDLAEAYKRHAANYYRKPDGQPTSEVHAITTVANLVADLFGGERGDDFRPSKLIEVRSRMVRKGWVRKSVNKSVGRLRAMFAWGVEKRTHLPNRVGRLASCEAAEDRAQ